MNLTEKQIQFAASQIGYIDSGERNLFLDSVNTEGQVEAEIFNNGEMTGVFYSDTAYNGLRIRISFTVDTDRFNDHLVSRVKSSMKKASVTSCSIWIRNNNKKIIEFLKKYFYVQPDGAHYYASIEFIMRRERFSGSANESVLDTRPFEEKHIDDYLRMLDGSMTFIDPPSDFMGNKEYYLKQLAEHGQSSSLEAFWIGSELIGLYWRKGAEIDVFAVDAANQRKGYGTIMLTRAIKVIFKNTDADFAYLYAVDWNIKGQSFYKKYGMEQNGHSYHLGINNYDGNDDKNE